MDPLRHSFSEASRRGFTLMELLLAMAIIAILSGAILVSISSQRQRAYQSKMLAELSGVIQPMLMCRTDGNTVTVPSGGAAICSSLPAYGTWPTPAQGFTYNVPNQSAFNDGTWYIRATDGTKQVCCNAISGKCHDQNDGDSCNSNQPSN